MQSVDLADTLRLEQAEETTLVLRPGCALRPDNLICARTRFCSRRRAKACRPFYPSKADSDGGRLAGGRRTRRALRFAGWTRFIISNLGAQQLAALGAVLGADVPFCLVGGACLARGTGRRLNRSKTVLPRWLDCHALRGAEHQNHFFRTTTRWIIRAAGYLRRAGSAGARGLAGAEKMRGNALAQAAMIRPLIGGAIRQLYDLGACYAAMSGSGPAVLAGLKAGRGRCGVGRTLRAHAGLSAVRFFKQRRSDRFPGI